MARARWRGLFVTLLAGSVGLVASCTTTLEYAPGAVDGGAGAAAGSTSCPDSCPITPSRPEVALTTVLIGVAAEASLTLTNGSCEPIDVTASIEGMADAGATFTVLPPTTNLEAGATAELKVVVTASRPGGASALLRVATSRCTKEIPVSVNATDKGRFVTPTPLVLPGASCQETSGPPGTITVVSRNEADVPFSPIFEGPFKVAEPAPATLVGDGGTLVSIFASPIGGMARTITGKLTIQAAGLSVPIETEVRGANLYFDPPDDLVVPSSGAASFKVKNGGNQPITFTINAVGFSVNPKVASTLAPNGTRQFGVSRVSPGSSDTAVASVNVSPGGGTLCHADALNFTNP